VAVAAHLCSQGVPVLVDGYNVAKGKWPGLELAEQRRLLIEAAENLVRRLGTDITIVFDGADVVGASSAARRLVRVRYSPAGVTADDVIRDEVAGVPADLGVVVVTDDAAIVADVRAAGANVIASPAFAALACA
jgi:predicted RNA-binding protein with PIN domain